MKINLLTKAGGWSPSVFLLQIEKSKSAKCKFKNESSANSKMQIANWKMDFSNSKFKFHPGKTDQDDLVY